MSLARFASPQPTRPQPVAEERCEMCARPVGAEHGHVADTRDRRIVCACRPCYLLFTPGGASQGRYKAIPERYARLDGFDLSSAQWDELQIPIDLAFFFYSTPASKIVAFYPSPAGATESQLPVGDVPAFAEIAADVEALLVNRTRDGAQRTYIVPIDACYQLVGLIRKTWKGFDGGDEAHRALTDFFAWIDARCGA